MKVNLGQRTNAFTLVETLAGMTVFSLIAVSIFAIVWQVVDVSEDLRRTETREQEIGQVTRLLRDSIEALPLEGGFRLVTADQSSSGWPELVFSDVPTAFILGPEAAGTGDLVVGLIPQEEPPPGLDDLEEPVYRLALSREEFSLDDDSTGMALGVGAEGLFLEQDAEGRFWLPLVDHVLSLTWRYWDEDQQIWLEDWSEEQMPPLLEMQLVDAYRGPLRLVFELPEHARDPAEAPEETATDASTEGVGSAADSRNVVNPNRPGAGAAPAGRGPGARPGGAGPGGRREGMGRGQGGPRGGGGRPGGQGDQGGTGGGGARGGQAGGGGSGGGGGSR